VGRHSGLGPDVREVREFHGIILSKTLLQARAVPHRPTKERQRNIGRRQSVKSAHTTASAPARHRELVCS
jgi:hypothetical protein